MIRVALLFSPPRGVCGVRPAILLGRDSAGMRKGSTSVTACCRGLAQRVGVQEEPHQRAGGIGVQVQLSHLEGKHRKDVAGGLVACRRAGAALPRSTEVGPALHAPGRGQVLAGITHTYSEFGHVRGDVEDHPVPPAAVCGPRPCPRMAFTSGPGRTESRRGPGPRPAGPRLPGWPARRRRRRAGRGGRPG